MHSVAADYINRHRSAILGTTVLLTAANIATDTYLTRKAIKKIDDRANERKAGITDVLAKIDARYPDRSAEYREKFPTLPWPS